MRRFLHLVNPVSVGAESDLFQAQPVTFETMRDARRWGEARGVGTHLCAVGYPEDAPAMPGGFRRLPDLTRSVLDVGTFRRARKLPMLADLVCRAVDSADELDAETIIYTNVDIALMPDFYAAVAALLDRGLDAFSITRRTLGKDWPGGVNDLPLMRAQLGEPHPGRDCFVFGREMARRCDLGLACIGTRHMEQVLMANLLCLAPTYVNLHDLHLTFHLGDDRAWMSPDQDDYAAHNRRELSAALGRLRGAGLSSTHPVWGKLNARWSGDAPDAEKPATP